MINAIRTSGLASIAILVSSAGMAWGQERPNGFYLLTPLSLSSGYDNKFVVGSQSLDDAVTLLTTPTMSWMRSTHTSMFSVDYQGEFELFAQHQNLDAWNHNATMHFVDQLSARWSVDLGESFVSTMDPTRQLENSLLLLPRGRFEESAFYTRLVYRLSHKTKVSARFDNSYTRMDLPPDLEGRLDRVAFAGTLSVDHTLTKHHALSASYAYLYVHSLQPGPDAIDSSVHNLNLGYIYTVNPGMALRFYGGVTHGTESSFTGAAALDKKVGDLWLSAGYQRYVAFFGGFEPNLNQATPTGTLPFAEGVAPNSVYNVASLRAWGKVGRRLTVEGNVQRALNGVTLDNRGIKSVIAQLKLDYQLTNRISLFTRTEFFGQNISEFVPFPMSRARYFGGIEFTLSRAPELVSNPNRRRPGAGDSPDGDPGKEAGQLVGQQ